MAISTVFRGYHEPMEPHIEKPGGTGFKRVVNATRFSVQGLLAAEKHESAFRQELVLAIVLMPIAVWITNSLSGAVWSGYVLERLGAAQ